MIYQRKVWTKQITETIFEIAFYLYHFVDQEPKRRYPPNYLDPTSSTTPKAQHNKPSLRVQRQLPTRSPPTTKSPVHTSSHVYSLAKPTASPIPTPTTINKQPNLKQPTLQFQKLNLRSYDDVSCNRVNELVHDIDTAVYNHQCNHRSLSTLGSLPSTLSSLSSSLSSILSTSHKPSKKIAHSHSNTSALTKTHKTHKTTQSTLVKAAAGFSSTFPSTISSSLGSVPATASSSLLSSHPKKPFNDLNRHLDLLHKQKQKTKQTRTKLQDKEFQLENKKLEWMSHLNTLLER